MSEPARFLGAFIHALGAMTLYPGGHPSREGAVDEAYQDLIDLTVVTPLPSFTFLDEEIVFGREPVKGLKAGEWSRRLVAAGIQRLEFERHVLREEFEGFLQEVLARLTLSTIDTSENRQMRDLGIRFGAVGLSGAVDDEVEPAAPPPMATLDIALGDEAETFRWLQHEIGRGSAVPYLEAEAVVRSLSVAMHADRRIVMPLLQLKEYDQYTTTHSLNVSVLAMGLAEFIGCRPAEVRAFGTAGLLHDIGKVRLPLELLTKPGKLTDDERALINCHPADGARVLLQSDEDLELAAVVAYEHHIMLNCGGYPVLHYCRGCTLASRLVHVCDVYDALRTKRPYRDAWPSAKAMAYLHDRTGLEFDPDLVAAFSRMLGEGGAQVTILGDARTSRAESLE
jgi:putative nucleotidyltransferase with HDIG domain